MNIRDMERTPPENKDASIKSDDDLVRKVLENIEKKEKEIHDLKLEI